MSQFIIGIDLGTTNSALAYVEAGEEARVQSFPVAQLVVGVTVDLNQEEAREIGGVAKNVEAGNAGLLNALARIDERRLDKSVFGSGTYLNIDVNDKHGYLSS